MVMAVLGFFVFTTSTVPYHSLARSQTWRHPHQNVVGNSIPPSQYTGKDPETVTISAQLRPEITGGDVSLDLLRLMAETGKPYPLILGTGKVLGSYVILSVKDSQSQFMPDGKARAIDFTMELKKVSARAVGLKEQALLSAAGVVRALVGV